MKNKSKTKIFILILGISFTLSTISIFSIIDDLGNNEGIKEIRDEINLKSLKLSGAYIESFIHIDGNWSATTSYDWCSGDGSWSNPYIIENVTIDASSSPTGSGIFINNSKNIYFIIRNCTVYNAPSGFYDAGIKLENTSNGTIINNDFSDNNYIGIYLYNDCKNNTISRNWADDNKHFGIKLENNCGNNSISENSFNNLNKYGGIYLKTGCDNNTIIGNTACGNSIGILIDANSDNNNISENYLFLNLDTIIIHLSENNIIMRNIMASELRFITDWGTGTIIEDNYILPNAPSLCVEIIKQFFSNAEFIVTLNISSGLGFNPWIKFIQVWWNGILVPSNSIIEIGIGLYNISLTPIFVVPGQDPILLNMTIKSANHIDKYFETFLSVRPYDINDFMYVEIFDQVFSSIEFNVIILVFDSALYAINAATIQVWWNGEEVQSGDISNLGGGLYKVSLSPITVLPEDDPILLNMTISASGYEDKYFETYLAVDPATLEKEVGEEFPLVMIIIAIISTAAGIGVATVAIFLLRRKRRISEGI